MSLEALRTNEKLKASSGIIGNVGTALFVSGFGRSFFTGLDAWAFVWIVFGTAIILAGIQLLSLLYAENAHG
jgi:hypothetical protein